MVRRRLVRAGLAVLVAAGLSTGCGEPPDKEIQQAQSAIDAARTAGADQYATTEFQGAVAALKQSHDAVEERDYRLALTYALDSRERAQAAARAAADEKIVVRAAAEEDIRNISTALMAAGQRMRAAEATRMPPSALTDFRYAIETATTALQKARAAFDREDFLAARQACTGIADDLRAAIRHFEIPSPHRPARRRR